MSILIPGMSLPPKGKRLFVAVNWCGDVYLITSGAEIITKHQPSAKAIELPPHGRLGDLDALAAKDNADYEDAMASIADVSTRSMVCQIHYGAKKMIRDAPTIIPAEGGDADAR